MEGSLGDSLPQRSVLSQFRVGKDRRFWFPTWEARWRRLKVDPKATKEGRWSHKQA